MRNWWPRPFREWIVLVIRPSPQGLHIVVYHAISCLLGPANKKGKTYYNLTSHINSLLRRRLLDSARRNCLGEPPRDKKRKRKERKTPA